MQNKKVKKIVAITSCPTGIAHTFLARDKLNQVAKELNVDIKIETQGRSVENRLTDSEIAAADVIILACDKKVQGKERFNGKMVLEVSTKEAIGKTKNLIETSLERSSVLTMKASSGSSTEFDGELEWSNLRNVYRNLMGGVSKMLPFVVAGGILLGIGFLLDIGSEGSLGSNRAIAAFFSGLGKQGLEIMVPILGGFIAYSIAGWQGFAAGMIAGMIAGNTVQGMLFNPGEEFSGNWTNMWGHFWPGNANINFNAGFIGAMVGGYVAGAVTIFSHKVTSRLPEILRGPRSIIFMPVMTVLLTGMAMFILVLPLGYVSWGLEKMLVSMDENNLGVLLGIVIGMMMAIDMGGPINKTAYVLGTSLIGTALTKENTMFMGAVMAAGMVPPLGLALSTVLHKKLWTKDQREAGKSNWLLGMFFITEGAIPFAASDPKRIIPALMFGSAVTGAMMYALQVGWSAPHGGIFVIGLVKSHLFSSNGVMIGMGIVFLLATLTAGTFATAGMLWVLKRKHPVMVDGKEEIKVSKAKKSAKAKAIVV